MSILGSLQAFDQDRWIELFILDATSINAGYFYFHAGTNEFNTNIIWQGQEYVALPLEASGFAFSSSEYPRPKLKLANIQGMFSVIVRNYNDLIGMKVIRKRTKVMFLDAVNFTDGNANANPVEELENEVYYVTQKTAENKLYIEFELGTALDLQGVYLPKRSVIANVCPFKYRGEECAYAGTNYFNKAGVAVATEAEDVCAKTVSACKLRFGEYGELSFGGFPGAALVDI